MFENNEKLSKESPLRDVYDFTNAKVSGVFCSANADSIGGMFRVMFTIPRKVSLPLSIGMLLNVLKYSDLDKVDIGDQLRLLRAMKREIQREEGKEEKEKEKEEEEEKEKEEEKEEEKKEEKEKEGEEEEEKEKEKNSPPRGDPREEWE
jgi:outer membrane biosynthesis protein TonB